MSFSVFRKQGGGQDPLKLNIDNYKGEYWDL